MKHVASAVYTLREPTVHHCDLPFTIMSVIFSNEYQQLFACFSSVTLLLSVIAYFVVASIFSQCGLHFRKVLIQNVIYTLPAGSDVFLLLTALLTA